MVKQTKRVEEILFTVWDPIGVNDTSQCADEYAAYAAKIAKMVKQRVSPKDIANHLDKLRSGSMGLPPNPKDSYRVALLLLGTSADHYAAE